MHPQQVPTLLLLMAAMLLAAEWNLNQPAWSQERLPDSWESDSTLRSIFFVDHDLGWAVGDRGTILKTDDGGRNWQSISSPRDLIWTQVFFINEQVGWITGGYFRGSLDRSVGVMIRTIDGGKSWQNMSQTGIPFVRSIEFADEQNGWIECDSNALYPSGLLITRDGGHHWKTPAGVPAVRLQTGLLTSQGNFLGVDLENQLIRFDRRGSHKAKQIPTGAVSQLVETADGHLLGLANGQLYRGLPGQEFTRVQLGSADSLTLNKVFSRGRHLWAVGSPGCSVFTSVDNGQTWNRSHTGQVEVLKSVFFLNEDRGWAVGDMGKIVATKDGGKTWIPQRNHSLEVGVLNLASSKELLLPECVALLAGSFNHRCAVSLVGPSASAGWADQLRRDQGLNRIGNSGVDTAATSTDQLKQIVRLIRTWKPPVIALNDRDEALLQRIQEAVEAASSAQEFPKLIEMGLRPWKVQKVIQVSETRELASAISINQYSAYLGRTVGLQARFANELLNVGKSYRNKLHWDTIWTSSNSLTAGQGITTGTSAYSNPHCQLPVKQLQINNMQQFRSIANWKQSLDQLSRFLVLSPLDEKSWNEQVTAATSGMDSLTRTYFLRDLADRYTVLSKPVMADHTERLILKRSIDSELGESTLWKMVQRYGSSESNVELNRLLRKRLTLANQMDSKVRSASADLSIDPVRPIRANEEKLEAMNVDVTPASLENAGQLIEIFQNRFPDLNSEPDFALQVAWLKQKMGNRSALDRMLDAAKSKSFDPLTGRRLFREKQLAKTDQLIDGALRIQDASQEKILLDGNLSESVWKAALSKSKWSSKSNPKVLYARDGEYLYVAGQLKTTTVPEPMIRRKRVRDESLDGYEKLTIFLDFDRDYCSGIELTVDVRGCCNDAIWRDDVTRDASFNPRWYIASVVEGQQWRFEVAIPLNELPTLVPELGQQGQWAAWVVSSRQLGKNQPRPATVRSLLGKEEILIIGSRELLTPVTE